MARIAIITIATMALIKQVVTFFTITSPTTKMMRANI